MVKRVNKGKALKAKKVKRSQHKSQGKSQVKKPEEVVAQVPIIAPEIPSPPVEIPKENISIPQEPIAIGGELNTSGGEFNFSGGSWMYVIVAIIIIIVIAVGGYFGYKWISGQRFVIADAGGIPMQYNYKPTYGHHVLYNENHGLGVPFNTEATNPNKYRLNTNEEYQSSILASNVEEKEIQAQKWRASQMPTNGMLRGKMCSSSLINIDKQVPLNRNIDLARTQSVVNKAVNLSCNGAGNASKGPISIMSPHHVHEVPIGGDITLEYANIGYKNIKNGELMNRKKVENLMNGLTELPQNTLVGQDVDNKIKAIL